MRKRDFSLNSLAEMARRGIKAKVPDTHREQQLFLVTAGENPQLDGLQLVGVCSTLSPKILMRKVSASLCPVPPEQLPINEYQELQDSWFFSWVTLPWVPYLRKLAWVWGWSWLIFAPVAAASFSPQRTPIQFFLSAGMGSSFFLALVILRLYLGWWYIRSRLISPTVFYEESGWYDGQTWIKTPEFITQDRLILQHQVEPLLYRLKQTCYGLGGLITIAGTFWFGLYELTAG